MAIPGCLFRCFELQLLSRLGEAAIAFQKRAEHERNQVRDGFNLSVFRTVDRRVVAQCLIEIGIERDRDLDRRSVGQLGELQFGHGPLLSSAIGLKDEVLVDNHAQRPAGPYGDGRLDVQVLLDDALASLIDALLRR